MKSLDPLDVYEATERITINGDEALVHHARKPNLSAQEFADAMVSVFDDCELSEPSEHVSVMLDAGPEITTKVHQLTSAEFTAEVWKRDVFSTDMELAIGNTTEFFEYERDAWDSTRYSPNDPTKAEVIAAASSLVNAAWCVQSLESTIKEDSGVKSGELDIYSEAYFDAQVTKGLMLAFRDGFMTRTPRSAIQGLCFHEPQHGVAEAIENVLGIELSDTDLHGLMLAEWNKSVCLEAASNYGQEKDVQQGVAALEGLVEESEADE